LKPIRRIVASEHKPFRPRDKQSRRILLIDDDPVQLRIRGDVLRVAGFEVVTATSAESALSFLRATPDEIGTVVTDHIMPGVSGAEFVRALRVVSPQVPVIVVSGSAEAQDEYQNLNVTFRQKPCPPPELIALVQRCFSEAA
jgi:DNA-binding NtrC family response regulator